MSNKAALSIVETQEQVELRILGEALQDTLAENSGLTMRMEERLANLDLIMEDVGWTPLGAGATDDGPTLEQLHRRSKQIRNGMALSPHLRNGAELLANRVWSDSPRYSKVPGYDGEPTGRGTADIGKFVKDPRNVHYVFGANARKERARAQYTDGVYFLLGDNSTKIAHPVPLWEITDTYVNPENRAEIWAYRRQWNIWNNGTQKDEPRVRWYFTDLFSDKAVDQINYKGKLEPVDGDKTLIDGHVNKQVGWALGFPTAGTVVEWARKYSEFIRAGLKMSDAMARLWAQVSTTSPTGGGVAGVKVAGMDGFGNTAVSSNALTPLSTAGKSYDFGAGTQVLAIVAAGLGVSVIALSANPGDAGSSYGAAQTLSLPERLATIAQRDWEAEYDARILRWMGAKDAEVKFPVLVDGAEAYRLKQGAQLSWNSGLYPAEQAKEKFEAADGNTGDIGEIPDGVLIPNNEFSEPRSDIDPGGSAYAGPDSNEQPTQAGGAGQGVSNGAGGQSGSATRDDTIAP